MLAAVVLLALVASSQVQALPGADPVAEVLSTELRGSPNILCLVGYAQKIQKLINETVSEMASGTSILQSLIQQVRDCIHNDGDTVVCTAQAMRDTWEGNEALRNKVYALMGEAIALAQEVREKCF